MRRRNPNAGLVVFWVKLMERGYSRTITGLYRVLKRLEQMPIHLPNPKYIAKPYEAMTYPGQRVQVDVKHVLLLTNPISFSLLVRQLNSFSKSCLLLYC